ncbi:MAG: hypothetical protein M5U26_07295 [Planctomycetota bacterium]|nr:hypothetical protein [Planctomycetota bacterium]
MAVDPIEDLGLAPDQLKAAYDARAEIAWGEPAEGVREKLIAAGLSSFEADGVLEACLRERAASFRQKGMGDMVKGGACFGGGAAVVALLVAAPVIPRKLGGLGVALGVYGVFLFGRGLVRVLAGHRMHGADTIYDEDPL